VDIVRINIEIAEYKAARHPTELVTIGLGSCVGICLYDPIARIGGLAHVMLPDSTQARLSNNKGKFVDTAVPALIAEMSKLGADRSRLVAKIVGGAEMFSFDNASDFMRIGKRNVEAVIAALKLEKIPLIAQDTGKNYGRSIRFCTINGQLYIKSIAHGEKIM
jgi:chemotaxis protein CheD